MRAFIGVTDNDWFEFLLRLQGIVEVNFWQPGGRALFKALRPGEIFLFNLHALFHFVVGARFFTHSTLLPLDLAWEAFKEKNGAPTLEEMRLLIERWRREPTPLDYQIGCILLEQPFFPQREQWIPAPEDFHLNIVQGKSYDLTSGIGKRLWEQVENCIRSMSQLPQIQEVAEQRSKYGTPITVLPRLEQGSFRILFTDAYRRRCAITGERTLPTLEAGHIKPFSKSGPHKISNGILFRSDIHRLFDTGYVTITPNYYFEVSKRIREEFENGKNYYSLHGRSIQLPLQKEFYPDPEFITWHHENCFKG